MTLWNHYHLPQSIEEAVELLSHYAGHARVVAGGTDLLLEIRQGVRPPIEALVDITHIPELRRITQEGDTLVIGAAVTHSTIVRHPLVRARATCLAEGCGVIGGPQVRNVATLGGNVAHALPAADGTTALVALDAEAEVWQDGIRYRLPISEMFRGPGESILNPTRDLLLALHVPLQGSGEASAFKRIMRPQGVALPILNCAVWVRLASDGVTIEQARVCIGPVGPTPLRALSVEEALCGKPYNDALLEEAVRVARRDLHPRASKYRATAAYREEMIAVLLRRALPLAVRRARSGTAEMEEVEGV